LDIKIKELKKNLDSKLHGIRNTKDAQKLIVLELQASGVTFLKSTPLPSLRERERKLSPQFISMQQSLQNDKQMELKLYRWTNNITSVSIAA
jgi:hypothetical protein